MHIVKKGIIEEYNGFLVPKPNPKKLSDGMCSRKPIKIYTNCNGISCKQCIFNSNIDKNIIIDIVISNENYKE